MVKSAIGVDIGGTQTKLVWLEESGEVIDEERIASPADSAADLVDAIAAAIEPWMSPGDRPAPEGQVSPGIHVSRFAQDRRAGCPKDA